MLDKKHNLVTLWGHLANVTAAITLKMIKYKLFGFRYCHHGL